MTTRMNRQVRLTRTRFRATSFGVLWRRAPSIRPIIRSRKEWPDSAVTRTVIWSLMTRVPPVTAERSPPASRTTGADSPVIADSSTVAMPSTISPSEGITSPAPHTKRSPTFSSVPATRISSPARSLRAIVWVRVFLRASAWALPRPSAMASAKLANRQVNHSHRQIWRLKPEKSQKTRNKVDRIELTQTVNRTRFLASSRGCNLRRASMTA